jgi:hypothetical protein
VDYPTGISVIYIYVYIDVYKVVSGGSGASRSPSNCQPAIAPAVLAPLISAYREREPSVSCGKAASCDTVDWHQHAQLGEGGPSAL